jgi:hypothetical protein
MKPAPGASSRVLRSIGDVVRSDREGYCLRCFEQMRAALRAPVIRVIPHDDEKGSPNER